MFDRQLYKKQAREQLEYHWKAPLLISLTTIPLFVILFFLDILTKPNRVDVTGMATQADGIAPYILIALIACFISGTIFMATSHFYLSFVKDNNSSTFRTFLEGLLLFTACSCATL